jgi:hypothetical protein
MDKYPIGRVINTLDNLKILRLDADKLEENQVDFILKMAVIELNAAIQNMRGEGRDKVAGIN